MRVIMLSGKPSSGKDTVGGILTRLLPGSVRFAFADRLKLACNALFDISDEIDWSAELKEQPTEFGGKTPRQLIGELSEFVRERYGQTHFIHLVAEDVARVESSIITDARRRLEIGEFKNMFDSVVLVRIERPSLCSTYTSVWETELDEFGEWDTVINNDGTLEQLEDKVRAFIVTLQKPE
jgi:hypothetical protein